MEERKRPELTNDDTKGQGPGVHRKNNNKKNISSFSGSFILCLNWERRILGAKKMLIIDIFLGSKVRGPPIKTQNTLMTH